MERIPNDLIPYIAKFLKNYRYILNLRLTSKDFHTTINQAKFKILFMQKYISIMCLNNSSRKLNSLIFNHRFNPNRLKCINNNNNDTEHGFNMGAIILYYPIQKKGDKGNPNGNLSKIFDGLIRKKLRNKLVNLNKNETKMFNKYNRNITDCYQELIQLSDHLIKPNECKYGRCVKRFVPYCKDCSIRFDIVDKDYNFIISD